MNKNYINIQGWMISELKLSGNELILFALIFGFSQDGQSEFYGSLSYIENFLGISRPTVTSLLKKLVSKKLIKATKESHYVASKETLPPSKEPLPASKETLLPSKETLLVASKETLPNIYNANNNTNNNYNNSNLKDTSRFAPPTPKEVSDYCKHRGNEVDVDKFFNFYEAKGWMIGKNKMKNWQAAVRTWEPEKKLTDMQWLEARMKKLNGE
jgi:hypothetical protein